MIAISTGLILIIGGLLLSFLGKQLSRFAAVAIAIVGLAWYLMQPSDATYPIRVVGASIDAAEDRLAKLDLWANFPHRRCRVDAIRTARN